MKQADALKILKAGRNVYLTGPAGSGKTYVVKEYIQYLREHGVTVALTASTGIAATHIGGVTIHSFSGMGIKEYLSIGDIDSLVEKEYLWKRFQKTSVLIIDEVSMMSATMFNSLDRLARAMKGTEKPFGGMQLVLSGDFFQLPPISSKESENEFVYMSRSWEEADMRICYLSEQWRQDDDILSSLLDEIRTGSVTEETFQVLSEYQESRTFGDITPTKLFTHNKNVDEINHQELRKLEGTGKVYEMVGKGRRTLIESLKKGVLAPESLALKKNAMVMFVKNNFEAGYVNGTLGTVIDIAGEYPVVRTTTGDEIVVAPTEWSVMEDNKVLAQVEQVPLRLAWAITIHKSQGMTLDAAEIDLSAAFVPGQGYVALSRLRSLQGLVLRGINAMALSVNEQILEFDICMKKDSVKWEKVIQNFSDAELQKMYDEFILQKGGTIDPIQVSEYKKGIDVKHSISTYDKTRAYVEQKMSLQQIATERELTVETILSHLETIRVSHPHIDMSPYKPAQKDLKKILEAFAEVGDTKLSPVHKKLKGVYDFNTLRLARLFLD